MRQGQVHLTGGYNQLNDSLAAIYIFFKGESFETK
jgi:hypothetical protein